MNFKLRALRCTPLAAAIASLFLLPTAGAQAPTPSVVAADLGKVTVIGTTPLPGIGQPLNEIPAPAQTATAADINRSQALDLTGFMKRNLGGVYVNEVQGNPFQADVNFRGYTASPLLGTPQGLSIYMDGVRLNQPFGDVVSWDLIPRAAIDSLTLMPGSNPLFGLNTLGGSLSIQTKDGRTSPGSAIQSTLGSNNRWALEFEHGGSHPQGFNWYITGNRFAENGWRDSSPSDVRQLFGKLGWADAKTDLSLTLAAANNTLIGNGLQEKRLLDRDYRSVYSKPDETANQSTFLNLSAKHSLSDNMLLSGNLYYRSINTATVNGDVNEDALNQSVYQPNADEQDALTAAGFSGFPLAGANAANTPFPSWRCIANVLLNDEPAEKCNGVINRTRSEQENYGLSGQISVLGKLLGQRNQFTAGAAYDASRTRFTQSTELGYLNADRSVTGLNAFGDGGITGGNLDGAPYDRRVDLQGRTRTFSVFASDTLSINERWHLTASGRFNHTQLTNADQINPGGGPGSLDGDHTFQRLNPALGLTFTPSPAFNAYIGYNEGSRTPTSVELGCADPANPCKLPNAMAGDPPLRQVVTKTWELGVRGKLAPAVNWNIGVFRAENYDDILFVADNAAGFGYFKNFGQTRRQGLELGMSGKAGKIDGGASLTLLDATFESAETVNGTGNSSNDAASPGLNGNINITPGNQIPLTPRQMFKLHVNYQASSAWAIGMGMNAVSSLLARGNENNQHQPNGINFLGAGDVGGYAIFDLSVQYRASPQWRFFAQVSNLFDRQYATAAQLGATAFDANGRFVARPLPAVGGAFPLVQSTFLSPGAPRAISVGLRYEFDKPGR